MTISPYECSQCGATDFEPAVNHDPDTVRCSYCASLFMLIKPEPKLIINKGARVVFGNRANVEIRGDVEIESGAQVDILGKVVIIQGEKKQGFQLQYIPPLQPGGRRD